MLCMQNLETDVGHLQKQRWLYPYDQDTDCWFQGADTIPTPTADCKTIKETSAPQIRKEILTCHVDPTMDLPCIVWMGLLFRKVLSYNITNPLLSVTLRSRRLTCIYKFVDSDLMVLTNTLNSWPVIFKSELSGMGQLIENKRGSCWRY